MSAPSAARPETKPLTYEVLKQAVAGSAAAFRCRRKLQPAGGPGDKVFPPTFAGAVYAIEERRIPDCKDPVTCVLLDSVQSQANRMEQALQDAVDAGRIHLPIIAVDFEPAFKEGKLQNNPGRITSLQAPHRLADAILRDSEYLDPAAGGKPVRFRLSSIGKPINDASPRNATAIYQLCPTALLFGMWDSTGPKGGLGAKFERAMVSEIIGVDAVWEESYRNRGVRRDPLEASASVRVIKGAGGLEGVVGDKDAKGVPPSNANHGSVPFDARNSGLTVGHAEQTTTISLVVLRRLGFEGAGADAQVAARCALAALGIAAATLAFAAGDDLRSRCLLWPDEPMRWELLAAPGTEPKAFEVGEANARDLLAAAAADAAGAGLGWREAAVELRPTAALVELVGKSQQQRPATGAEE